MTLTIVLNGKVIEGATDSNKTLEALAAEWKHWAQEIDQCSFEFVSGMQIVYRDLRYGSVLTAYVTDPADSVSFQVLEMG